MAEVKRVFKTVKKLAGQKEFRKWDDWSVGDVLIAKYVSQHTDQYGKQCYVVKVLDAQFKKLSDAHRVNDKELVLNACGILDYGMKDVEIGQIVQIVYNGKVRLEKGKFAGKESHAMDIDIVVEDGAEVEEEQFLDEVNCDDDTL